MLQRFLLITLLSFAPLAIYSKAVNKKNTNQKNGVTKRRTATTRVAGKYPTAADTLPDVGGDMMTPVKELDSKIKQKEQELQRLSGEIAALKVQRVKLHAETMSQYLNNRQRRIDDELARRPAAQPAQRVR